jgi:TATA-binding protein-associated factor
MSKMTIVQVNHLRSDPRFSTIPIQLPQHASIGGGPDMFGVSHVRQAIDWLDSLHNVLSKPKKKKDVTRIDESKRMLRELLYSFEKTKAVEDARVAAAFAAAAIALKTMPGKLTPLIKGVMNGLRVRLSLNLTPAFFLTNNQSLGRREHKSTKSIGYCIGILHSLWCT